MKLHLPKRLFTALLTAITLAAAPAALTLGSAAWGASGDVNNLTMGNAPGGFYGGNFAFNFQIGEGDLGGDDTSDVLALYWGTLSTGDLWSNGFTLGPLTDDGGVTLIVGAGALANAVTSGGSAEITENTTFTPGSADDRNETFRTSLQTGKTYTLVNVGGNGAQTVMLLEDGVYKETVTYNGNMHGGTQGTPMGSVWNTAYDPTNVQVWNGKGEALELNQSNFIGGTGALADTDLIFASGMADVATTVKLTQDTSAKSIAVYDNYTFATTGATADVKLSVTDGITVAAGKTLTLSGTQTSALVLDSTINDGAVKIDGTVKAGSNLVISDNGSVTVGDGSLLVLGDILTHNNGALVTEGTGALTIDRGAFFANVANATLVSDKYYSGGDVADNGFLEYEVDILAGNDLSNAISVQTITRNGSETVQTTTGVIRTLGSTYYINSGTETYRGADNIESGDIAGATGFVVQNGTLNISKDGNISTIKSLDIGQKGEVCLTSWNASLGSANSLVDVTLSNGGIFSFSNGNSDDGGGKMYMSLTVDGSGTLAGSNRGSNSVVYGTVQGNGTLTLGQKHGTNWWTVAAAISDDAEGALALNVTSGNEYIVLSGANTYTGGTTIAEGALLKTDNTSALGSGTVTLNGGTLALKQGLTISELSSTVAASIVKSEVNATLTVSSGSYAGALQNGSGTLSLTKTGAGTLTLSGALGTEASRLGNVTAVGGELKLTGTGYVSTLEISGDADVRVATGGNLDVTTFNASTNSVNTNRNVYIENGATVTANEFKVAYNMGTVEVDGTLNANTELYLGTNNDDNVVDLLSGTGVINAAKLRAGNWGSYGVNVATLNIGANGLVVENGAVLNLASTTTTVAGATTVNGGNELNFNGGSATLNGAVTNSGSFNVNGASVTLNGAVTNSGSFNVNGASVTLNGGVSGTGTVGLTGGTLTLAAGQTNEIALFNYGGGTLNHSGLTVTDATFSGITLDNTANNGTLQLNGTLNVTSTYQLTSVVTDSYVTGSYVGGAVVGNGFLNTTYLLIQGGSIGYGEDFTVTLGGSAVEAVKEAGSLKIKLQGQGDFFVNGSVESISTASSALGYCVASGAELIVDTETSMHDLLSGRVTAINGAADAKLTITQSGLDTYDGNGTGHTDYSLTSTFAGILELDKGVIFTLGRGDGTDRTANYTENAVVDLSSLAGLVLRNGAELWYNADGTTTIANVSVSAGDAATIYYKDSKSANQVQLTGKTQLHGTLNLTTKHDGGIAIKNLVGNGTLNSSSGGGPFYTTISSLQYTEEGETSTFTGSLSFTGSENVVEVNTGEGADITLTSLSATGVNSFTFNARANTTIGTLTASAGVVNVEANKTLTLGGGTEENPVTHSIGTLTGGLGSMLNLAQHAVLDTITTASGVTLSGSGTYKLDSGTMTMTSGVTLGADWTGAVRLSGSFSDLNLNDCTSLYDEDSWIEFAGVSGYMAMGKDIIFAANIRLTDIGGTPAINHNNGGNGDFRTFTGKIEGEGTWKRTNSGGTGQNYVFAGDVAGWTGAFVNAIPAKHTNNVATATNLTFQGASDINVNISNPGAGAGNVGALNVTINDAAQVENKSAVAVNGSIQATKLTVDTAVSADFSNTVDVDTLEVNAGKTATFNNTATAGAVTNAGQIKLGEAATVTGGSMSKVQMSSTGIIGTPQDSSIADADIEIAQLAQEASFTIQDMTLTNTSINAASVNTQVNLTNVSASATQLSGGKFVVTNQATMTTAQVATGGSEGRITFSASTTLLSGITLNSGSITVDLGDLSSYVAMGPGKYDLSITLGGFSMGEYTGDYANSALQFAAGSWLSELLAQDNNANVQISITQATEGAAAAAAGESGGSTGVSYSTGNVGMVITITGLNVPEPTTATLSLLALAALAGRRRRK